MITVFLSFHYDAANNGLAAQSSQVAHVLAMDAFFT